MQLCSRACCRRPPCRRSRDGHCSTPNPEPHASMRSAREQDVNYSAFHHGLQCDKPLAKEGRRAVGRDNRRLAATDGILRQCCCPEAVASAINFYILNPLAWSIGGHRRHTHCCPCFCAGGWPHPKLSGPSACCMVPASTQHVQCSSLQQLPTSELPTSGPLI